MAAFMGLLGIVIAMLMGLGFGVLGGDTGQERRIHTLFSVECQNYFDWQTVGFMHSFKKARQPGPVTRLLSCTNEEKKKYKGMKLAPTFEVPSMSRHPVTGDWYPAINKPAAIVHWLKHSEDSKNVDWVIILDADMIIRGPILPWELGAEKGWPVAAYYGGREKSLFGDAGEKSLFVSKSGCWFACIVNLISFGIIVYACPSSSSASAQCWLSIVQSCTISGTPQIFR